MRHNIQHRPDIQDYRPACLPTLRQINDLPDDKFREYLHRGCQPELGDSLWLFHLIQALEARIERLEAREGAK